jgi:hypothetical protein
LSLVISRQRVQGEAGDPPPSEEGLVERRIVRQYVPDPKSGMLCERRGTLDEWVDRFGEVWAAPVERLDLLLGLLSPWVHLIAPGYRPTQGRAAARRAFESTFAALPDLTAVVTSWGLSDKGAGPTGGFSGTVYMEMTFSASIGDRRVSWPNVDRITFVDGEAVERVAHFDPTQIRSALLRSPSGLLRYVRLRMRGGRRGRRGRPGTTTQ